jgi:hypothetical protein
VINLAADTNKDIPTVFGEPMRSTIKVATQYITRVPIPPMLKATPLINHKRKILNKFQDFN